MDGLKICAVALLGLALCMILRSWKPDLVPLVRISLLVLFGTVLITLASPLIQYVRALSQGNFLSEDTDILFRALGIALLSEVCASVCRESGECGLASGVELTGKIEILLLSLPLMGRIITLAGEFLEMGGGS